MRWGDAPRITPSHHFGFLIKTFNPQSTKKALTALSASMCEVLLFNKLKSISIK